MFSPANASIPSQPVKETESFATHIATTFLRDPRVRTFLGKEDIDNIASVNSYQDEGDTIITITTKDAKVYSFNVNQKTASVMENIHDLKNRQVKISTPSEAAAMFSLWKPQNLLDLYKGYTASTKK